jgi:hypothetical protein
VLPPLARGAGMLRAIVEGLRARMMSSERALRPVVLSQVAAVVFLFLCLWAFAKKDPIVVYQRF